MVEVVPEPLVDAVERVAVRLAHAKPRRHQDSDEREEFHQPITIDARSVVGPDAVPRPASRQWSAGQNVCTSEPMVHVCVANVIFWYLSVRLARRATLPLSASAGTTVG